jgi:hypothetical protein
MTIRFDIPADVEAAIARSGRDAASELKEAGLVQIYRLGRISHGELAHALGIARTELDRVLKSHHVTEDLPSTRELADQLDHLRKIAG